MTPEDYLNALRQQKVKPIEQAWQKAKDTLANQQTELQQEQNQALPQYDVRKNQEDQSGWQQQQALMRRAQATGNTTSGQLDSNMSMINNSVMNNKFGVDAQKQSYMQSMANRMNQIKQGMTQNDMDKESNLAGLEGEIASKRYEMAQAQKAAASRGGGGGGSKVPSISQLNRQDKLNSQDATAGALDALYRDAPNMSRAELNRAVQQMRGQWYRDGVDMKEIQQALEGVQTRDEIEQQQKEDYQKKLDARPWYQRAIDAVLPGSQWG